jgi:hypothetical protein
MITDADIDKTELHLAESISVKYRNNEMSATELGNRLKYLHEYATLMKRALEHMRTLEVRL